jgi:hypothetical protein
MIDGATYTVAGTKERTRGREGTNRAAHGELRSLERYT